MAMLYSASTNHRKDLGKCGTVVMGARFQILGSYLNQGDKMEITVYLPHRSWATD